MSEEENREKYRWRGKFVSEKQHKKMLQLSELGKRRKGCKKNSETDPLDIKCKVQGNRIVDLAYMSKNMNCTNCKARLDLQYIEQETVKGVASIFSIRCHECLLVNTLKSGEKYTNPVTGRTLFSINTKLSLGAIQTGVGATRITRIFRALDLPAVDLQTFKRHEKIIKPIIDAVAKDKRENVEH